MYCVYLSEGVNRLFRRFRRAACSLVGLAVVALPFHSLSAADFSPAESDASSSKRPPNIIVIFTDDQGYGDLGCFGSETISTPNLDAMAAEGRRFTSFYSACSVCSPSRAALLTGCYPKRVGMHRHVLFPQSDYGLNPNEITIADHLRDHGYATACIGKWHLGHHGSTLPTSNGFDSYYGIPYSNDMNHPDNQSKPRIPSDKLWENQTTAVTQWNTPLMRNTQIIELPVDQRTITRRYTDRAIEFVRSHQNDPFFLYLPHSMPHIPLYVPEDVYDPNPQNAYKCVIEHIDAEVGRLMTTLHELGLDDDTIVIYTSDNGPWLRFKNHGGSAGPLRDGKGTTFEGGQRVPCVMWAPGRIPAGTSTDVLVSTIDLMPTIAALTGTPLDDLSGDAKTRIDGMNVSTALTSDQSPRHEFVYYSAQGDLEGIRIGDWKYLEIGHKNHQNPDTSPATYFLFNLSKDLGEKTNLYDQRQKKAAELKERMNEIDREVTTNARPVWRVQNVR